jgi:hypothetical protein
MRMAMPIFVSAAAALALAAPASARGDGEGTVLRDKDTRIVIVTDEHRDGRHEDVRVGDGSRVRVYSLDRDHLVDCGADRRIIDRSAPDGREHSKVVLCTRGEEVSSEDRSARLEHVLERIQHMDGLSDSSKERVTAALRGAIEELRNSH